MGKLIGKCYCNSVVQLCLTLCDPIKCSTLGLSVPHHLPEFAQVHVHYIGNAVQSCPTLWEPMDRGMPGLHVPQHLPEFAQVHVHCHQ